MTKKYGCLAAAFASALFTSLSCAATDGTWKGANLGGGSWEDTANWVDGVVPNDGGVATFNLGQAPAGQNMDAFSDASAPSVELSELRLHAPAFDNQLQYDRRLAGPRITLVPPARILCDGGSYSVQGGFLSSGAGVDVTLDGRGRWMMMGDQALGGKIRLTEDAWMRAERDGSLGATPATLVPDAITLDGGLLQNAGDSTLAATRGITVTEKGGFLTAGYQKPAKLQIDGPVTGPGAITIVKENSPVVLTNPNNDWTGDTNVGVREKFERVNAWSDWFGLILGADEVIPHGEGHGVLNLAPQSTAQNRVGVSPIDLDGHHETVNAVNASLQGVVRSTTPGGVLETCGAQDMDFRGQVLPGATVALGGTGRMTLAYDTAYVSGTLELRSGALDFAARAIDPDGRLVYRGGDATVVARLCETNDAATYASTFVGVLDLKADLTLAVAAGAGPLAFGGSLVTDAADPHTLTVVTADGSPLRLGGTTAAESALVRAPISCANGIVASGFVWLQSPLPEGVVMQDGATLTYDYAGALAQDVTLGANDLRVTSEGVGDGAITVPTGRTVIFSTQAVADDGSRSDSASATRTYANPVILQGGTLVFDGAGTTQFNGPVSGSGTIVVSGSGTVVLADGRALEAGCRIDLRKGALRVASDGALGAATVKTMDGRLGNVDGVSVTVSNPVIANSGGIDVAGADATLTLTGAVTYASPISKWGAGTLVLGGTEPNNHMMHVRGGTLVLAKASAITHVIGCEPGCTVRIDADDAIKQEYRSRISLDGGTLDLNGHDVLVPQFDAKWAGSRVVNGGAADATLTVTETNNVTAPLTLADGAGRLFVRKCDPYVWDLSAATVANSGLAATNGVVRFAASGGVKADAVRFTATKARPSGEHQNTGIQMDEIRLLLDGAPVAWPEGTAVTTLGGPASGTREGPDKLIDGSLSTKWYFNGGVNSPVTITCGEPVVFDGYQFATANDATGRDPVDWKFEFGRLKDGQMVWTTLDEQNGCDEAVPLARNTWAPVCSVKGRVANSALPEGYALDVRAPATVVLSNACDRLTALAGDGHLVLGGSVSPTLAAGSTFTGSVAAVSPVALAFDTAAIPGLLGEAAGTTFVNDGVAGALTFADRGACVTLAGLADGTAQMGLVLTGDTTLIAAGTGGDHTGPTTVAAGATLLSGAGVFAKYIRFTPLKGSGGQETWNMQFSELQLMSAGTYLPWPEGTTGASENDSGFKGEGAQQLLDGSVDTKCYWGSAVSPVLVTLPAPVYFDGYRWYSGNDSMDKRNPVSWTFEYSMDGETWTLLDEQADRETTTQTKTLAYTFTAGGDKVARNGLSDVSPVTVAAGGTVKVSGADETLGGLSGAGTLAVASGTARLNATADAVFSGAVSGAGTLAKTGSARQTLSGAITLDGTLVVEAGVLDLTGATLTGVTNIVLKGGALVGAATVTGDLTVTGAGGAYGAELAVSGALKLEGALTLATGFAGAAVRGNAFTFASTDDASRAIFATAVAVEAIPRGWKLVLSSGDRRLGWCVAPGGSTIYIR